MSDEQVCVGRAEDVLLIIAQEATESAYEKYSTGELTQDELDGIYELLRQWTLDSEKLLELIH